MPPATKVGTPGFLNSTCCSKIISDTCPMWPPASLPSKISPSTPKRTICSAMESVEANDSTFLPAAFIWATSFFFGKLPAKMTVFALDASTASLWAGKFGAIVTKFTAKGLSVCAAHLSISAASASPGMLPAARQPKPPWSLTAFTSVASLIQVMAPHRIG